MSWISIQRQRLKYIWSGLHKTILLALAPRLLLITLKNKKKIVYNTFTEHTPNKIILFGLIFDSVNVHESATGRAR